MTRGINKVGGHVPPMQSQQVDPNRNLLVQRDLTNSFGPKTISKTAEKMYEYMDKPGRRFTAEKHVHHPQTATKVKKLAIGPH